MKCKIINQKTLSAECWLVQVWGTEVCKECSSHNTKECGGIKILETGRNELGYKSPLHDIKQNGRNNEG